MPDKFSEFRNIKATPEELKQACNFIRRKRETKETREQRRLSKVKKVEGCLFFRCEFPCKVKDYFIKHKGYLAYNYPIHGITATVFIDDYGNIYTVSYNIDLCNMDTVSPDDDMIFLETSECTSENIKKLFNLWKPYIINSFKGEISFYERRIKEMQDGIVKCNSNIRCISRRKAFKLFKPKKLKGGK